MKPNTKPKPKFSIGDYVVNGPDAFLYALLHESGAHWKDIYKLAGLNYLDWQSGQVNVRLN